MDNKIAGVMQVETFASGNLYIAKQCANDFCARRDVKIYSITMDNTIFLFRFVVVYEYNVNVVE